MEISKLNGETIDRLWITGRRIR